MLNIEWIECGKGLIGRMRDNDQKFRNMFLFSYSDQRNVQFYFDMTKEEAIKRFTEMMENRTELEKVDEGFDALALELEFAGDQFLLCDFGAQVQRIFANFLTVALK